jgi:hypothetical protein
MRIQLLAGLAALAAAAGAPSLSRVLLPRSCTAGSRGYVAVKAGTIHLVEEGKVLTNGTLLLKGERIQAVGTDIAIPVDARIVDYGPTQSSCRGSSRPTAASPSACPPTAPRSRACAPSTTSTSSHRTRARSPRASPRPT